MSGRHDAEGDESEILPLLHNVVYCSHATAGVDDAEVARIVEAALRNNPRFGITGLLVFGSGVFFQWLEGPRASVTHLMQTLLKDPRHDHIIQLSETEERRERVFPNWDMELVAAADIREVLEDALTTATGRNVKALRSMLLRLDAERVH